MLVHTGFANPDFQIVQRMQKNAIFLWEYESLIAEPCTVKNMIVFGKNWGLNCLLKEM